MVSMASFAAMITTLLLSMVLPVAILIVFALVRRKKGVVPAWLLGAAGFFVMQVIIRLPIISVVSAIPSFAVFVEKFYILYVFVLALTAALFEVVARFGVAKILQKNMNPEKGLAAGLGHGGIEAIFLIGMTYVSNLLIAVMINTGTFTEMMEAMAGTGADSSAVAQVADIRTQMITTAPSLFLLAGYERVLTMIFHAAMSLLVCYLVYKRKAVIGVLIAFLSHFAVDFISPVIQGMATPYLGNVMTESTSLAIIYTFLTIVALASLAVIVVIMIKWKKEEKKRIAADEQTA